MCKEQKSKLESEELQLSPKTSTKTSKTSTKGTYIVDGRFMHDLVYRGEAEATDTVEESITIQTGQTYGKSAYVAGDPDPDLISRQGVIDAIEGTVWYRINKNGEMVSGSTNEHESWYKHDDIMSILKTIPSPPVEPKSVRGDLISRQDAIRWVKTECNPYGKPTLDYDSGLKVIEHLKKMPSAPPPAEPERPKRTETMMVNGEPTEIDPLSYEVGYSHGQSERPKGEWVPCTEPPKDRRNVFLAHGTNDFKSCCIGHYEQNMGWYEDRNFFAKPIYDCKYWCDIPDLPDMGDNQFDMRGDK